MKSFIQENFLLQSPAARSLYKQFAESLPVIDYHNHLSPTFIVNNKKFTTITELWLAGDHYKWRAMRANGIPEHFITGKASEYEKFFAWAKTVPQTLRNPLYHWTHLELKRYFDVDILLHEQSAKEIYDHCNALLQQNSYCTNALLKKMNVEVLCTTDDPCDSLNEHKKIKEINPGFNVFPAFRPDAILEVEQPDEWIAYVQRLSTEANISIRNFTNLMEALQIRHDYFAAAGCRISDHGLQKMYTGECSTEMANDLFRQLCSGKGLEKNNADLFRSEILYRLALMDHDKNWVQQYHIGSLRNNNTRLLKSVGKDAGADSIGNTIDAATMAAFFERLDNAGNLGKTIVYNLNPADNAMIASMLGNFQGGSIPGKMQYGAAWWFLDQKSGIEDQLNAVSNMGLLSRFVGMTTDSRSFLSFPRHEYFRRILCNLIGTDMENGELPSDENLLGEMIQNICYHNAKIFFGF